MKPYANNPRYIMPQRLERLTDTLARLGDLGGIVHNLATDEIIGGNQRMTVFTDSRPVVVETYDQPDEQGTVGHGWIEWRGHRYAYRQVRWDAQTAAEANIAANLGAGDWDWQALAEWDAGNLEAWGFDLDTLGGWWDNVDELANLLAPAVDGAGEAASDDGAQEPEEPEQSELSRSDVPDAVFASDNDLGIPLLDANLQAQAVVAPVQPWGMGAGARSRKNPGTWHFYTDDYRFDALWRDPSPVVNSGCVSVVEPNFSAYLEMPRAVALWAIYRKRWLARWWQSKGIRVFVDLNVAEPHYSDNLLGVPKGWRSWATRGYVERLDNTVMEYDLACEHAGTSDVLFFVYGGGRAVKDLCNRRGWVHVIEQRDAAKER